MDYPENFENYWSKSRSSRGYGTRKRVAYLAWKAGCRYAHNNMRYDALTAHMEGVLNDRLKDSLENLANDAICDVLEGMKENIDAEFAKLSK